MPNISEISQNVDPLREQALKDLFKEVPPETRVIADLPSKGKFYSNFQQIVIRPLNFEDEKIIVSSKGRGSNLINLMISRCIEGISVNELLIMDKMYLLMKIRELSYGEDYDATITCKSCGVSTESKINLTLIKNRPLPPEITDPRETLLPVLKKKIKVRFPRIQDEVYFTDAASVLDNLWRFVVSLDGKTDPVFISDAIKLMHLKDIGTISNAISRNDLGMEPRMIFDCPTCGTSSEVEVPISESFFSVI